MNGPTLSKKLKSENKKYHSSVAVVLFVVFITVTVLIFFLAVKGIFDKGDEKSAIEEVVTEETTEESTEGSDTSEESIYIVEAGDTLYAIGIELGADWQEIADINNIEPPYSLSTGQELIIPQSNNSNNNLEEE